MVRTVRALRVRRKKRTDSWPPKILKSQLVMLPQKRASQLLMLDKILRVDSATVRMRHSKYVS